MKNAAHSHTFLHKRRAAAALALASAVALTAACATGNASTATNTTTSTASTSDSSGVAWTTITSAVREASIAAIVQEILDANADTSKATSTASSAEQGGSWDSSQATTVTLNGSTANASGQAASSVQTDGSTLSITAAGTYVLSGSWEGQIVVNAPDAEVHIVLNGVTITNDDGPAINIQDVGDAVMVLAANSTNTLTDGATYADTSEDASTAALFSSDTLVLTGTGSLTVNGQNNDGISSKNGLAITGTPTISVTATDDGIRGKDWLLVEGGTITVDAGGDGLKSSEDDDETKGFIALGEASITITSGDDSLSATTDVTVNGTTLNITAGGGQANATVQEGPGGAPGGGGAPAGMGGQPPSGGMGQPTSGGAPGDQSSNGQTAAAGQAASSSSDSTADTSEDTTEKPKGINAGVAFAMDAGTVTIDAADEGLQAAFISINGGELDIASGDDGINASDGDYTIEGYENAGTEDDNGANLSVTGGVVQIDYAGSDGIDSNGTAQLTGGIVMVNGTANGPDGAVDVNGESTIYGITGNLSVSKGETVTVSGGTSSSFAASFDATSVTLVGLTEGTDYTVTSTSGSSISGTATAQSGHMMGGPGRM